MSNLLVQGPPLPTSPWVILMDEQQGSQAVALALDGHILVEFLEAFKASEPWVQLVDHSCQVCIPHSIHLQSPGVWYTLTLWDNKDSF